MAPVLEIHWSLPVSTPAPCAGAAACWIYGQPCRRCAEASPAPLPVVSSHHSTYRDIKCANILVDVSGSVKLADFGLAKTTTFNDVKSCKGTPFWMAPEVVKGRNRGYGLMADIWSLGCTVLEMLTGQIPYSHLEGPMQAMFRIGRGEPPPIPDSLSNEAQDFILKCLQVDPDHRPTAAQLLDHPFLKKSSSASLSPASPNYYGGRQ